MTSGEGQKGRGDCDDMARYDTLYQIQGTLL